MIVHVFDRIRYRVFGSDPSDYWLSPGYYNVVRILKNGKYLIEVKPQSGRQARVLTIVRKEEIAS